MVKAIQLTFKPETISGFLDSETIGKMYNSYLGYIEEYNQKFGYDTIELVDVVNSTMDDPRQVELAVMIINSEMFWNQFNDQLTQNSNIKYMPMELFQLIQRSYSSVDNLIQQFITVVNNKNTDGCVWVVTESTRELLIIDGDISYNPIQQGYLPLIVLNVSKELYFPKYQNNKLEYCKRFWSYINWYVVRNRAMSVLEPGKPVMM
jgi:superoxide dismutase